VRRLFNNPLDRCLAAIMNSWCGLYGIRTALVTTPDERAEHDALVQRIFYQAGYYPSPDTRLLPDLPDSHVQRILVRKHRLAVGALSVIENSRLLPVDQFFCVQWPAGIERARTAEVTRYVLDAASRRRDPALQLQLLQAALRYSVEQRNLRWWVFCMPAGCLLGFLDYFRDSQVLRQLPPGPEQLAMRRGRESYFLPGRELQITAVDLDSISVRSAAGIIWRRYLKRKRKRPFVALSGPKPA
jgi:hypothetical protein